MLSRAEGKARDSLLEVAFERGLSNDLPYPAGTFNVVRLGGPGGIAVSREKLDIARDPYALDLP